MVIDSAATIRKGLEFANELAKCGYGFVVIPIIDENHRGELAQHLGRALSHMEAEVEASEK